jgi:ribose transport system substrate-binding protein
MKLPYARGDRWEGALSRRQFLSLGATAGLATAMSSSLLVACGGGSDTGGATTTQAGPDGLTKVPTAPFDPTAPAGAKPELPRRMGVALPAAAEIWTRADAATRQALEARGVDHVVANADGDSSRQVQQINSFFSRGVGAMMVFALDPATEKPLLLRGIKSGIGVFTGVLSPSTCQTVTDQYAFGLTWGKTVARYVRDRLAGSAQVVIFNEDNVPSLKPRHKGILEGLRALGGGVRVVADETLQPAVTTQAGFAAANTILSKNPGANVWIGADPGVLGALAALESKNNVTEETALFGTNGDSEALKEILKGGPFKGTFAFAIPALTYAMGQYAADWLEGKSIPQLIYAKPVYLNSSGSIEAYERDMRDPSAAFRAGGANYYRLVGNISYETRNRYIKVDV